MMREEISDDVVLETTFIADTTCATCHAEFLDAEDLEVHIQQMHATESFTKYCQFCEGTYSDLLDYAVHIRNTHLMDLRSCLYCVKVFIDGGKLQTHEKKHFRVDKTLYSCSQCDSMFNDSRVLELHECKNHDNEIDGFVLKVLPYLSSILCLKAHLLLKTVGKKTFKCTTCGFASVSLNSYNEHLDVKECKVCVCNKCSGVYKNKKNIIKHIKTAKLCQSVDDYCDEATPCKDCSVLVHPKAMRVHLKNCNPLKCNDCDIVYETIDEFSAHYSKHHPLDMSLARCRFCLKEYFGEKSVKKHIEKIHKPEFHLYKYKCIECNLIFKHPQKLFAHYFTRHKELHPFTCRICNKTFRVRKGFSLHIKLDHKSIGFVEFNDEYHVFFTDKKSDKPFVPECVLTPEERCEYDSDDTDTRDKPTADLQLSDTDMTDAETPKKPLKRKLTPKQMKSKQKKTIKKPILLYSSDEEPLMEVKKRVKNQGKIRRHWNWKKKSVSKKQFNCTVCNMHCYTFQHYQNHMSLHDKNQKLECVKCSEKFSTKNNLTRHMQKDHASSKLTETLKSLIQKKKHDDVASDDEPIKAAPKPEKFKITMKKVKVYKSEIPATITPAAKNLSVKNFIENFTPDTNEATPKDKTKVSSVTIKRYNSPYYRESTIKLTKFKDSFTDKPVALKMPQRFKQYDSYVKTKINIKLVQTTAETPKFLPDFNEHNYSDSFQDNDYDDQNNDFHIPEVAQEVSLEGTEEIPSPKPAPSGLTKIIIPKMPPGYSKLHIATLQTEAPYFKIIKVDSNNLDELKQEAPVQADVINLPGGTKLVNANPLAHLLGNTPVEKILEPTKNKHYKPVITDFQSILAQAMQKLETPPPPAKNRKWNRSKKAKDLEKKVES